jgi:hypothetical protein
MGTSLQINRVVVLGKLACDYRLHPGLNVLQGVTEGEDEKSSNKSGKTALVYLIQYGLGKEASKKSFHFDPISGSVSLLFLEVELENSIVTIERSMQNTSAAVRLYLGKYYDGITNNAHETVSLEALGDFLLTALGIPKSSIKERQGELDPLSFRLLMRAFILEQKMSFASILEKVQPEQRKSDIVGFLSGIYSRERFHLEERLSALQIFADDRQYYLDRIRRFLEQRNIPSLLFARAKVSELENLLVTTREKQKNLRVAARISIDDQTGGRLADIRGSIIATSRELLILQRHERSLRGEIERLAELRASLVLDKSKVKKLQTARLILTTISYEKCPRCLQILTEDMKAREAEGFCSLCSRPALVVADSVPRSIPRLEDIEDQLNETDEVLTGTESALQSAQSERESCQRKLSELEIILERETQSYVSPFIDALEQLSHEVAVTEKLLATAQSDYSQAMALDELEQEVERLRAQQMELEALLEDAKKPSLTQLTALRNAFREILGKVGYPSLLNSWISASDFMPTINGSSYVHGGQAYTGLAVLAYHLSLFKLAVESDCYMPRLLIIDSPAVGDMNDQTEDVMLDYLASLPTVLGEDSRWQVILTTRRCTDALQPFVFDQLSSPHHMLLQPAESVFKSLGGMYQDD